MFSKCIDVYALSSVNIHEYTIGYLLLDPEYRLQLLNYLLMNHSSIMYVYFFQM